MGLPAIFWDRDGTLIEDPGYLKDPEQVKLLPGAADAVRRLAEAGFENIVVTNQSGIARGLFDETTLEQVHERLKELLARQGANLDAIYYCPYLDGDDAVVQQYRKDSDLRKPRPGMLALASLQRKLDLAASWSIGDSIRDAQAGRAAGCRTILVVKDGQTTGGRDKSVDFVVGSLSDAVERVLKHTRQASSEESVADSAREQSGKDPGTAALLREILTFLRMVDRRQQADDFSLPRLAGAIVQMLALGAIVWAVFSMIRGEEWGAQFVHMLFALVLQMLALTLFMISPRK